MDAKYLVWVLCAGLMLGAACRSQSGSGGAGSSGGEAACAHEPGVPPEVGEGDEPTTQRPCRSSHSVMGEDAKRPDEL